MLQDLFTKVVYKLTTTFNGAGSPTILFFASHDSASNFLDTCENGEIDRVTMLTTEPLNLFNGCTYADLTYGGLIRLKELES